MTAFDQKCDICGGESGGRYVGVASVPGAPVSIAWCSECLARDCAPTWIFDHDFVHVAGGTLRGLHARLLRAGLPHSLRVDRLPQEEPIRRGTDARAGPARLRGEAPGRHVRRERPFRDRTARELRARAVRGGVVPLPDRTGVGMSQPGPVNVAEAVVEACARAAHEVNRAYCLAFGDASQPPWEEAPDWQTTSARSGARGALAGNTPEQSHEAWLREKRATGWRFGPVKNPEEKEHPCLVPYAELPESQRAKDVLFVATVRAVARALGAFARSARASDEPGAVHRTRASDALFALNRISAVAAHDPSSSVLDEIQTLVTFIAETTGHVAPDDNTGLPCPYCDQKLQKLNIERAEDGRTIVRVSGTFDGGELRNLLTLLRGFVPKAKESP